MKRKTRWRHRLALAVAFVLACAGLAGSARAEVEPWDPEKVKVLADQLRVAADELYDAFRKQPILGVAQNKVYYRLKQDTRRLRIEARHLSDALAGGAGRDETLPIWQDLMQEVRSATEHAPSVFKTQDVQQKAEAARAILDRLAPYYGTDGAATGSPAP
jgi:hypothetical protein